MKFVGDSEKRTIVPGEIVKRKPKWDRNILVFWADWRVSFKTVFLPVLTEYEIAMQSNHGRKAEWLIYLILSFWVLVVLLFLSAEVFASRFGVLVVPFAALIVITVVYRFKVLVRLRGNVRNLRGIPGHILTDAAAILFCYCCALCQMRREIAVYEEEERRAAELKKLGKKRGAGRSNRRGSQTSLASRKSTKSFTPVIFEIPEFEEKEEEDILKRLSLSSRDISRTAEKKLRINKSESQDLYLQDKSNQDQHSHNFNSPDDKAKRSMREIRRQARNIGKIKREVKKLQQQPEMTINIQSFPDLRVLSDSSHLRPFDIEGEF